MLLPDNIRPELSIYYIGSQILSILKNNRSLSLINLFQKLKEKSSVSFQAFVLSLDWLYLINAAEVNEKGDVVTDVENIGTKNYGTDPVSVEHLFKDVLTYYLLSNSPNDKTPFIDRTAGPEVGNSVRDFIEKVQTEIEKNISGIRKVLNDFYKLKIF